MIEFTDVTKNYLRKNEYFAAVDHVSFTIEAGEMVALTGPSGSGKTTLLNMLACLIRPDSGSIVVRGEDILRMSEREQAAFRNTAIGYVLQGDSLLGNFSVYDNVCMPAYIAGDTEGPGELARKLLEEVGLSDFVNEYPDSLSGGEMRRAAVARAFINKPQIILADEPTSNLDPENSHKVMQLLRKMSRKGTTVIFSTHELEYLSYADHEIRLENGRIREGSVSHDDL